MFMKVCIVKQPKTNASVLTKYNKFVLAELKKKILVAWGGFGFVSLRSYKQGWVLTNICIISQSVGQVFSSELMYARECCLLGFYILATSGHQTGWPSELSVRLPVW